MAAVAAVVALAASVGLVFLGAGFAWGRQAMLAGASAWGALSLACCSVAASSYSVFRAVGMRRRDEGNAWLFLLSLAVCLSCWAFAIRVVPAFLADRCLANV